MTLTIPTYEEIIAAWHALEDETESSATLMQRVCHHLGHLIGPEDVASAVREGVLKARQPASTG